MERGLLTQEQLVQCLEVQRSGRTWRPLGEILLRQGYLTGRALASLLLVQEARRSGGATPPREAGTSDPPDSEIGWLLRELRASGGSAVVLGAGATPAVRVGDQMIPLEGPELDPEQLQRVLSAELPTGMLREVEEHGFAEGTTDVAGHDRVRVTVYRHAAGLGAVFRPQISAPVKLDRLGLPAGVRKLARAAQGLIVVTGPTGAGRSVTLTGLLETVRSLRACHVVTLEDPVETYFGKGEGRVSRRRVAGDTETLADAVHAARHAGAQVIALHAFPDGATITAAVEAAEAGCLVLALMHTNGVVATLHRLLATGFPGDQGAGAERLAGCLRGVLTQHAVPAREGESVVLACELFLATESSAELLRAGRLETIEEYVRGSGAEGMLCLDDELARLVADGQVRSADAFARAVDPERLHDMLATPREAAGA